MKTNTVRPNPDRLNFPLASCYIGRLSSAVFTVCGDITDDVDSMDVEIERTTDPDTHQPCPSFTEATRQTDGTFRCRLSPFCFPEIAPDLHYHVMGTDTSAPTANPRRLGTGALRILGGESGERLLRRARNHPRRHLRPQPGLRALSQAGRRSQ